MVTGDILTSFLPPKFLILVPLKSGAGSALSKIARAKLIRFRKFMVKFPEVRIKLDFCHDVILRGKSDLKTEKSFKKIFHLGKCRKPKNCAMIMVLRDLETLKEL